MSTTELNTELAERVVLHALINPDQHDQCGWYYEDVKCGTAACLSGWTVLLGGSKKQINRCINRNKGWADEARVLLGVEVTSATWDELTVTFFTYDNARAIEMFCKIFDLDLGALKEKAMAARGDFNAI
jgi:hypothetical protein